MKKYLIYSIIALLIIFSIIFFNNYVNSISAKSAIDHRGMEDPMKSGAGVPVTESNFVQSPTNQYVLLWFNTESGFAPMIFYPGGRAHLLPLRYKTLKHVVLMWDEKNRIVVQETGQPQIIFELKDGSFKRIN